MSAKSGKDSQKSDRSDPTKPGLPFEPVSNRKKSPKKPAITQAQPANAQPVEAATNRPATMPQVVSQRMARRMAFFCGIPTTLGMLTFIVSYFVVTNQWLKVPNVAVVLVSMGFFGLGVLGLTYGVLSASWDEARIGSWHGWEEFRTNLGRLLDSWRSARQKQNSQ